MPQQPARLGQPPPLLLRTVADPHHHLRTLRVIDEGEAEVVVLDEAAAGEAPFLVAAGVVALVECDGAVEQVAHGVQAVGALAQLAHLGGGGVRDLEFGVDVVQVPFEGLALEALSEFEAF